MRRREPRTTIGQARRAVTLVELMVVIALIGLLVGLTATAVYMLPGRARVRATEALISKIDAALQRRLNEAINHARAGTPIAVDQQLAGGPDPGRVLAVAVTRAVRQQLPERFILEPPGPYRWREPTLITGAGGTRIRLVGDFSPINLGSSPLGGGRQLPRDLPPGATGFVSGIQQAFIRGSLANHNVITTRAECLFMIVAGGIDPAAVEGEFNESDIGDTDGDGLPEFVDAWGNPIIFFLWPYQYRSELQRMVPHPSGYLRPQEAGDPLDPEGHLTDAAYVTSAARPVFEECFHPVTFPPGGNMPFAYRTYPLIVSAGPDGRFGLLREPGPDGVPGTGDDGDFVDAAMRLGDVRPAPLNHPEFGADSDNIDNHSLRVR